MSTERQKHVVNEVYDRLTILCQERFYGHGYISSGGETTSKEIAPLLKVDKGSRVLDVGSGTGGFAFYLAKNHGVHVIGMDVSQTMLSIANERAAAMDLQDGTVEFKLADIAQAELPEQTFDAVSFRGSFLHVPTVDKPAVLTKIKKCLKPGGRLLTFDLCSEAKIEVAELQKFVSSTSYDLLDLPTYKKLFTDAGFAILEDKDRTDWYVRCAREEVERVQTMKADILKELEIPEDVLHKQIEWWIAKRLWAEKRGIIYVHVLAQKQ